LTKRIDKTKLLCYKEPMVEQKPIRLNSRLRARIKKMEKKNRKKIEMLVVYWGKQNPETPCADVSAGTVDIFRPNRR